MVEDSLRIQQQGRAQRQAAEETLLQLEQNLAPRAAA